MRVVEFAIERYDELLAPMKRTPGVAVRDADSRSAMARYLERNPGLSFVAEVDGKIVGCALCGHDGRRGYLQHVIVTPAYRTSDYVHLNPVRARMLKTQERLLSFPWSPVNSIGLAPKPKPTE